MGGVAEAGARPGGALEVVERHLAYQLRAQAHPRHVAVAGPAARLARCTAAAEAIARELGISISKSKLSRFASGEIYVRSEDSVRGADVFVVQTHADPVNEAIMEQLIMIDALKRASAKRITAVIPYYGYSRQDKKGLAREPISAKLIADLLTAAGANRVVSVDLHAGQIQGYFDFPFDHLTALPILGEKFNPMTRQASEPWVLANELKRDFNIKPVSLMAESIDKPGFQATVWYAFFAPAGTPTAVVARLNAEITKTTGEAQIVDALNKLSATVSLAGPTEVAALEGGKVRTFQISPREAGLAEAPIEAIAGGDPAALVLGSLNFSTGAAEPIEMSGSFTSLATGSSATNSMVEMLSMATTSGRAAYLR